MDNIQNSAHQWRAWRDGAKALRGLRQSPSLWLRGFVRKIYRRFAGALGLTVAIALVGESLTPHCAALSFHKKGDAALRPLSFAQHPAGVSVNQRGGFELYGLVGRSLLLEVRTINAIVAAAAIMTIWYVLGNLPLSKCCPPFGFS